MDLEEKDILHENFVTILTKAQVKGRNTISWEEKFEYDVYYADHCNLLLDLKILFITLFQVLKGQGVNPDGQDIMPEFMGTKNANEPYKTD